MLKIKSIMHVEVNGRDYEFSCSTDSPLHDVLDANNQINAFLLGRVEQAKNAQSNKECPACPEMPPVAEPVTEEVPQG